MPYRLNLKSRLRLRGVDEQLVECVRYAITITPIYFTVLEGLRTKRRQGKLVARGSSRTMRSKHLTGHAVDLGVLDRGSVSWHWQDYVRLAYVMRDASAHTGCLLRWGGCWSVLHQDTNPATEVKRYVDLCRKRGRKAFLDGPHFELSL